ncbi:DUF1129 family protein [Paraliobacillus sp. X-1268]|uniref:DUF1129 family protein n=1 Tax=Paraliobacillus sp. X-1268 TaxID=2213193 RepID=UPI000E3D3153|nr:DUF1129 family protein [Paraliobacillus sp. X-1268]
MHVKELIEENNQKRKQLNKENLYYYEEMLVYIRLSFDKSEQATEEILTELLDHLLTAQEHGRSVEDIFGDNPKQYADEIVGELPKMVTKERITFVSTGILSFLAALIFASSIIRVVLFYIFGIGEALRTTYLPSILIQGILSVLLALLFIWLCVQYLRWSAFKKIHKVKEFFILWLVGTISISTLFAVFFLIPDFGIPINIPYWVLLIASLGLFLINWRLLKK